MNKTVLKKLQVLFKQYPKIKLVYFFGSRAIGKAGPMSDYDFAFYFHEKNELEMFKLKTTLMAKIGLILKTDKVDIVILNLIEKPELKYNIIAYGQLIFEKEPFKVIIEPKILNEYFDFHIMLKRYGLTKG